MWEEVKLEGMPGLSQEEASAKLKSEGYNELPSRIKEPCSPLPWK